MSLGNRLRKLREQRGLNQKEFALKMGIPNQNVSNYERGFRQPDYETLLRFADYFEVSIDYLLGRAEIPNTNNADDQADKSYFISKIATEFPDIELMFKDMESLSAEDMKEVYDYIKFKKSQKK